MHRIATAIRAVAAARASYLLPSARRARHGIAVAVTTVLGTVGCGSASDLTSPIGAPAPAAPISTETASHASSLPIEIRFIGDVPDDVRAAAKAAADRWMQVVVGPVLPVQIAQSVRPCGVGPLLNERVSGVVVFVRMSDPDSLVGLGGTGGACGMRSGSLISYEGLVTVSTSGLANSRAAGYLPTIFLHELGHVLGIGTNWSASPYLRDANGENPVFAGPNAMQAAFDVGATASPSTPIAISHRGESGEFTHWRAHTVGNDIMLSGGGNALTAVSAATLRDLGYQVQLSAVDAYQGH